MQCTSPRTVGFKSDGKTISWSQKNFSKEFATFQLPCGKCISCRLEYARQWAVRCIHEAQMHENNSFVTLTYSNENLNSQKLDYRDFQLFMKRLRKQSYQTLLDTYGRENWLILSQNEQKELLSKHAIGVFVTGEYGDKTKRPHWHAILFNWRPNDTEYKYSNDRGDRVYTSNILEQLWGKGIAEIGQVTFESAGYCARYAAKKLIHGSDQEHEYEPISKKSSKHAIGKRWIEKFWADVFNYGLIVLPDGKTCSIPRYYEKWFKENQPEEWLRYVTKTKNQKIEKAILRKNIEALSYAEQTGKRGLKEPLTTRNKARKEILKQKFKLLQEKLKL